MKRRGVQVYIQSCPTAFRFTLSVIACGGDRQQVLASVGSGLQDKEKLKRSAMNITSK